MSIIQTPYPIHNCEIGTPFPRLNLRDGGDNREMISGLFIYQTGRRRPLPTLNIDDGASGGLIASAALSPTSSLTFESFGPSRTLVVVFKDMAAGPLRTSSDDYYSAQHGFGER
jgi:hypothetical protein